MTNSLDEEGRQIEETPAAYSSNPANHVDRMGAGEPNFSNFFSILKELRSDAAEVLAACSRDGVRQGSTTGGETKSMLSPMKPFSYNQSMSSGIRNLLEFGEI